MGYPKLNGITLKPGVHVFVTDRDHGNWDAVGTIISGGSTPQGWILKVGFEQGSDFDLSLDQISPDFWDNTEEALQEYEAWKAARAFRVFISYASEDRSVAQDIYNRLKQAGMEPWFDVRDIPLGVEWDKMIRSAIQDTHIVLILLSTTSTAKTGYFYKEVGFALERAEEQDSNLPFILPVKLEDVPVPDRLAKWQWVNWYEERGRDRLMDELRALSLQRQKGD